MVSRNIEITFASRRDARTMSLLSRDLIEAGLGWGYRADRVARMIDDPDTVALVARDAVMPIAFAVMKFGDERAHLALLAVAERHQRCGVGRRLLTWLIESAMTAGIVSVHVELRADNRAAFAFYRSLGFAETLRVPGYYQGRETAIRMIRMLRAPAARALPWRLPRP
ncbi:MAG TPA: GNAT family N-acetyltransferase [Casimicrobiaceae bacterium]|nr:GNAT family N-acetyltransferase [Casimicrobiaceae bacterium]